MKIKIMTDSGADLSKYEIIVNKLINVELTTLFDAETEPTKDLSTFWEKLLNGQMAKTSQPAPSIFYDEFEKAKEEGYAIIYVALSSKLSGTYQTACTMKNMVGYEHIYIVDSLSATVGQKVLVLEAISLTKMYDDPKIIAQRLEEHRHKIKVFASIDTLKYLARSGRISKASAAIGELANVKAIISIVNGEVINIGKAVGTPRAINKLIEIFGELNINYNYPVLPVYAYDSKNCTSLINKLLSKQHQIESDFLTSLGCVIGTHVGPGGYGFACVVENDGE